LSKIGRRVLTEERYHTLGGVAELLQVSERTVHRWIRSGALPAYKPGGDWRIGESDLESFLESRRVATAPKAPASPSQAREVEERRTYGEVEAVVREALSFSVVERIMAKLRERDPGLADEITQEVLQEPGHEWPYGVRPLPDWHSIESVEHAERPFEAVEVRSALEEAGISEADIEAALRALAKK
jgi:excisionase family DNA binding protein